jgi:hypothetical protein
LLLGYARLRRGGLRIKLRNRNGAQDEQQDDKPTKGHNFSTAPGVVSLHEIAALLQIFFCCDVAF